MKDFCILSDFDGTITTKDGLYAFIESYAQEGWQDIEQDWSDGKISSKECLTEEFNLVPNLSEELIDKFIESLTIDIHFKNFYEKILEKNIDFYIVSDGIDYFIDRILKKYGLNNMHIISNHGEFVNGVFKLSYPNDNPNCTNNSGTCKCAVIKNLRNEYRKIYYVGDGVSDYCAADKADILFAKKRLAEYCDKNKISYNKYYNFKDIMNYDIF